MARGDLAIDLGDGELCGGAALHEGLGIVDIIETGLQLGFERKLLA